MRVVASFRESLLMNAVMVSTPNSKSELAGKKYEAKAAKDFAVFRALCFLISQFRTNSEMRCSQQDANRIQLESSSATRVIHVTIRI